MANTGDVPLDKDAVLLVGHGGLPSDAPPGLAAELKKLEGSRRRSGDPAPGPREAELDRTLRAWPRTAENDPYRIGFETIVSALARAVAPRPVYAAYNEFCAPTIEEAVDRAVAAGAARITVLTTMVTAGGSHAAEEIPEAAEAAAARHPGVAIVYAWPYPTASVVALLEGQLADFASVNKPLGGG